MRYIQHAVLLSLFSFLAIFAKIGIGPACIGAWYQPEVPKSMLK